MGITLYLGNIGSGKTAAAVKEMVDNPDGRNFYTDIIPMKPKLTPQIKLLKTDMLVLKEPKKTIKRRDGRIETEYNYTLNEKFWKDRIAERKSIIIDEAHKYLEARRFMSRTSKLFTDFLALGRRIIEDSQGQGEMIFITQLGRRADVILRDMAHEIRYFKCWYWVSCQRCRSSWQENSDMPDGIKCKNCPSCGSWQLKRHDHVVEVKCFAGIKNFQMWDDFGRPANFYYRRYTINDIGNYFKYYDTRQWSNMFSGL